MSSSPRKDAGSLICPGTPAMQASTLIFNILLLASQPQVQPLQNALILLVTATRLQEVDCV